MDETLLNNISLALFILVLVSVLWGLIVGLFRGLNKTLSRGIWLLLTALILILITPLISRALLSADISFLGLKIEGVRLISLEETLSEQLKQIITLDDPAQVNQIVETITIMTTMILNIFIFEVLFWLLKYLLLPLNAVFTKLLFTNKKEKEYKRDLKQYNYDLKQYKKKRGKKIAAHGFADGEDVFENELGELEPPIKSNDEHTDLTPNNSSQSVENDNIIENENIIDDINSKTSENFISADSTSDVSNATKNNPLEYIRNKSFASSEAKNYDYIDMVGITGKEHLPKEKQNLPSFEELKEIYKSKDTKEGVDPFADGDEIASTEEFKFIDNEQPEKETRAEKPTPPIRPSKKRLLGGLAGMFIGVFLSATFFMPLIGAINLASDINTQTRGLQSEYENQGLLSTYTDNMFDQINTAYQKSYGTKIFTYTGMEFLADTAFTSLTSVTINDEKIVLRGDVENIIEVAKLALDIQEIYNTGELDANNLNTILEKSETLIVKLFDIKTVQALGNVGLSIAHSMLPELISAENINIYDMCDSALIALKGKNMDVAKADLIQLIATVKVLNKNINDTNVSLLSNLINEQVSLDDDELISLITSELADELLTELFKMETSKAVLPGAVNLLLGMVAETVNYDDYNAADYLARLKSNTNLQTAIKNLVVNALTAYEQYDESDDMWGMNLTMLSSAGKVLNILKSDIITSNTYSFVLDRIEEMLSEQITNLNIPTLDYSLHAIKKSIRMVNDWERELTTIGEIIIGTYGQDGTVLPTNSDGEIEIKNIDFQKLGAMLNKLQGKTNNKLNSVIFGNIYNLEVSYAGNEISNVRLLLSEAMDYVMELMEINDENDYKTIIENVMAGIKSNILSADHIDWESDFEALSSVIDFAMDVEMETIDSALSHGTMLSTIGKYLDEIKNTTLFGGGLTKNLTSDLLDQFASEITSETLDFSKFIDMIKDNIADFDEENDSWETEFSHIQKLIYLSHIDLENNLTVFGNVLDSLLHAENPSKLISTDGIISIIKDFISDAKFEDAVEDSIEEQINDTLDKLNTRLTITTTQSSYDTLFSEVGDVEDNKVIENDLQYLLWQQKLYYTVKIDENTLVDSSTTLKGKNYRIVDYDLFVEQSDTQLKLVGTFNNNILEYDNQLFMLNTLTSTLSYFQIFDSSPILDLKAILLNVEYTFSTLPDVTTLEKQVAFWSNELNHLNSLLDLDFDTIDFTNSANLTSLGKSIDKIVNNEESIVDGKTFSKNSKLILSSDIQSIIHSLIDIEEFTENDNETIKNALTNFFEDLKDNLLSKNITSFEREFGHIASLANATFDADDLKGSLEDLGAVFDGVAFNHTQLQKNSALITMTMINSLIADILSEANTTTGDMSASVDKFLQQISANINDLTEAKMNTVQFLWSKEFEHYVALLDSLETISDADDLKGSLTTLGAVFDGVAFNHTQLQKNSALITMTMINSLIADILSEANTTTGNMTNVVKDFLEQISANINDLTEEKMNSVSFLWSTEFNHYVALLNSLETISEDDIEGVIMLSSFGETLDARAFNYGDDANKNAHTITKTNVNDLVVSILGLVEIEAEDGESLNGVQVAFNKMIASVITNIENLDDQTMEANNFSWTKETVAFDSIIELKDTSDRNELLGNLVLINSGIYFDHYDASEDIQPHDLGKIYAQQLADSDYNRGIGYTFDNIVNNADETANSQIITKTITTAFLVGIFDYFKTDFNDNNASLDSEIKAIFLSIAPTDSDNYEAELKSTNYLMDILENITLDLEVESTYSKFGEYLDHIASSEFSGHVGVDLYNNAFETILENAVLADINTAVNTLVDSDDKEIKNLLSTNKELLIDDLKEYADFHEQLYTHLFETIKLLEDIEDVEVTYPHDTTIATTLSEKLEELQANEIFLAEATRYIAVYIVSLIIDAIPSTPIDIRTQYINESEFYNGDGTNMGFKKYLISRIDNTENELYYDEDNEITEHAPVDNNDYSQGIIKMAFDINNYIDLYTP